MKRFKNKQQLQDHIESLCNEGYLTQHDVFSNDGKNNYLETNFKINYGSVKP